MPQANPGDWWYTHGASLYPTTTTAATTITINPYQNANTFVNPQTYQQNLQAFQQAPYVPAPPLLGDMPAEGSMVDYPEIARLRRRVREVTQLCAA